MEIEFSERKLEKIIDGDVKKHNYPISVIKSVRRKITVMYSASDDRDLRNWKSLNYEKLSGDKDGLRSIRINDQWRLVFELIETAKQVKIIIKKLEDYH